MENKPKTELIVQLTGEDGNVFNPFFYLLITV